MAEPWRGTGIGAGLDTAEASDDESIVASYTASSWHVVGTSLRATSMHLEPLRCLTGCAFLVRAANVRPGADAFGRAPTSHVSVLAVSPRLPPAPHGGCRLELTSDGDGQWSEGARHERKPAHTALSLCDALSPLWTLDPDM